MFLTEMQGLSGDLRGVCRNPVAELFTNILKAMGTTREAVSLVSVIRTGGRGGGAPAAQAHRGGSEELRRHVEDARPEFICALGPGAARMALGGEEPFEALRGEIRERSGVRVMATHHPADLLDSKEKKRETWNDLKQLMAAMGA